MNPFTQPIRIGGMQIANRVFLAPLAGVSDVPFRRICREHGAGLAYVEMLSANGILHGGKRTFRMMARHESEDVLGVQVTGNTPEDIADAVTVLDENGFDTIDINMGCPMRKIVAKGWGSAILREPERLSAIVRVSRSRTRKPLSVKCRLGYSDTERNIEDTSERVSNAEADMLTIHGRTRAEDYSAPVDLSGIRTGIRHAANLVTVGNGDVLDHRSALHMMERTGCDAVMVSRGALGNPWIFRAILDQEKRHPTPAEWLEVVTRHIEYHESFYGPDRMTAVTMRKHALWYCSGYPHASRLRDRVGTVSDLAELRGILRVFADALPRDIRRYQCVEG